MWLLRAPLVDANFRNVVGFMAAWNLASNVAAPFITVYLLRQIGYELGTVTTTWAVGQTATALTMAWWGRVSDRLSNKAILRVALPAYFASLIALAFIANQKRRRGDLSPPPDQLRLPTYGSNLHRLGRRHAVSAHSILQSAPARKLARVTPPNVMATSRRSRSNKRSLKDSRRDDALAINGTGSLRPRRGKLISHGCTRPLLFAPMFVDSATLQDLEIVPTPTVRGTTVWSLIDRTRTRVGREALRERLLNPPHTAKEILALQRAHHVLATEASAYRSTLDQAAADDVERYLNANWQLPRDMPPLIRLRRWFAQYLRAVERGHAVVSSLLESAADLRRRLTQTDAAILQELGNEIGTVMDAAAMQELRGLLSQRTSAAIFRFDQLARERAKSSLARLLQCVGTLEALWSVGVATSEHGWTYPRPSSRLRAVGLYHPFLGQSATANDLHLDDQVRVCFVTGPNMAGKSTFLKATAVAVLLAHTGSGVPAASMEFMPVGTVFSSVQIVDSLTAGESFFLAEVRRIGALAAALADHRSAVAVIDEPFRGTNVHDAAEATLAVMTRLAAHPAALVFVASHVAEVVPTILADPRIAFFYFAADATGDAPRFDYRLRGGVSEQRLGMTLLRQEGVLDRLERSVGSDAVSSGVPETHYSRSTP